MAKWSRRESEGAQIGVAQDAVGGEVDGSERRVESERGGDEKGDGMECDEVVGGEASEGVTGDGGKASGLWPVVGVAGCVWVCTSGCGCVGVWLCGCVGVWPQNILRP